MPKARKKVKAALPFDPADFVDLARDNPYVHRLVEDSSIRDNIQRAYDSSRKAVERLSDAKNPAKALIDDKKLQSELRTALEAVRDASTSLTEGPTKKKAKKSGGAAGKLLLLAGAGGVAAVAASEGLRSKVLDALFGAEEEFQYTPPAEAAPPAPAPPVSAV